MEEPSPGAGLAILRVWVEDGTRELRARLTTVDDVGAAAPSRVRWTGAGTETIVQEVRRWFEEWGRSRER
jgi:hypothetical protein